MMDVRFFHIYLMKEECFSVLANFNLTPGFMSITLGQPTMSRYNKLYIRMDELPAPEK